MCGFAGFVSFQDSPISSEERSVILDKMGRVLSRRGPDEQTVYDDGYLSFVFRRLAIVDVEHGTQPIWNEDHTRFVSVNGEIYNHEDFRDELADNHQFSTRSDSEAVLHLFEEYGEDCFRRLNGMFAIMLYDADTRQLTLARDRLGIKPLYWAKTMTGLVFASELKALLMHPECPREINFKDLDLPVGQQKCRVSSYVRDVQHLEAGSYLSVGPAGQIDHQVYWNLDDYVRHENEGFSASAAIDQYEQLINDATTKRLMSDVPVGLYLSGGIDSSLLAAIAAKHEKNLHCFTVVENTTVASGDAPQAVKVAEELGVPLYGAHFDVMEFAGRYSLRDLERMVVMIESPRFDPEWLFKCELHRFAKEQVPGLKVVLLGQGADEFAGGYSNRAGTNFESWNDYLSKEVADDVRFYCGYEKGIPDYLKEKINLDHFGGDMDTRSMDYHEKMQLHVYQMQHFNLWHEDRSSSFYGLEARVPYLDHRLAEFLVSIPDDHLEELFWDKTVVRKVLARAMENYPPDRKKVPFIATRGHSTIDKFVLTLAGKLYPAYRMLYQEMDPSPLFQTARLDEIFEEVQRDTNDSILRAWEMMAMMSLGIFEKFCRNPDVFLEFIEAEEGPVCRRLSQDEMNRLEELYPEETVTAREWVLTSKCQVPGRAQLLSGLGVDDQKTDIYLKINGQIVKTLSIPNQDSWVVNMLGKITSRPEPGSVEYWSNEMNVQPQQMVGAMDYLVSQGFLERLA